MDVFRGTRSLARPLREPVVAIGNFDGVHVGHQQLLALAIRRARARGGEAVVLTFDPHPAKVLAARLAPPLICTLARRESLIAGAGIDAMVIEPFTRELAGLTHTDFVDQILVGALGAREVVVGYDFTYGRARAGNTTTLRETPGLDVHVVPPFTVDGLVASSTKIREFIHEGNVEGAAVLLGREFDVEGEVQRGAGRGRSIGIPTANVATDNELLPRPGVYAGHVDGMNAVINLGRNPTFVQGGGLSLEAHLLEFDGDLYNRRVRVGFHSWLRGEERFPSAEALVAQIRKDIDEAKLRLGS
jgi:riboflavin kinase / FMN adenylyltransferase